ncbi:hypothetical protein AUL38_03330 [Leucobacter sp. G161]|nr:hypothetical protein AUL38_03330 [Leucobacter sp. G161]
MHIAFFSDQHPGTLGGLQVSLGTQRRHLELRGHTVTVCAPNSRRVATPEYGRHDDVLLSAQQVGEQSFCLAGERCDRVIDAAFARKPPVDIVHVQADGWGAWNGYRFAHRHGLPLVHTMHTNIEIGLPAIMRFPRATSRLLFAAQQRYVTDAPVRTLTDYTRAFAERADLIIAPTRHFAERLGRTGVAGEIHVLPTGVDDATLREIRATPVAPRPRPQLVWPGRVSPEKQLPLCSSPRSRSHESTPTCTCTVPAPTSRAANASQRDWASPISSPVTGRQATTASCAPCVRPTRSCSARAATKRRGSPRTRQCRSGRP